MTLKTNINPQSINLLFGRNEKRLLIEIPAHMAERSAKFENGRIGVCGECGYKKDLYRGGDCLDCWKNSHD